MDLPELGSPEHGAPAALSDEVIVRRVLAGEGALFELLMRRYNQRLYRVARSIVKNDAEAEDVMQQAYVNAYSHLDQFGGRARFSTWLTRIAVYEALARVRRRGRFAEIDPAADDERSDPGPAALGPDPEQQAYAGELRRSLEVALASLPPTYRTVLVLRDVEELSTEEAAECLGISADNVKTRLRRARSLLRERLFASAGLAARDAFPFAAQRCDRMVAAVLSRLRLACH